MVAAQSGAATGTRAAAAGGASRAVGFTFP
jgi:hypothetical protein